VEGKTLGENLFL